MLYWLDVLELGCQRAGGLYQQAGVQPDSDKAAAQLQIPARQRFVGGQNASRLARMTYARNCMFDGGLHIRVAGVAHMAHGGRQIRRANKDAIHTFGLRNRINVFQALDNGQVAPVPVRYTDKVAQIEDNLCHITECFVPDYGEHYILITYMSTDQDPLPSVSDSAFSTFYSYEIENGVARMYCFFAYIPEFSEGYTVYINQDAVVIN